MGATSLHFSQAEMCCPCCAVNLCQQSLLDALEAFRAIAGKPVIVTSGYRCPEHNKAVGGAKNSQHTQGLAADIKVTGLTAAQLEAIARQVPAIHGIGRNDHRGFLHVDTRTLKAQWCYELGGHQCPYYST